MKPVIREHFDIPAITSVSVYFEEILDNVARFGKFVFLGRLLIRKHRLPLSRIYSIMKIHKEIL
jgi:hypothetical protein